ncbi:MAG: hypothetical protein Q8J63_08805 [Candidatus Aquicultor sp.]|nr:hypothetical protein [Candidatus Aquicultor sp.]
MVTEPAGVKRTDEPVEVVLVSDKVKPQGEDIRVTDAGGSEIPCQVSATATHTYRIAFIAKAEANSSGQYRLYFGNPSAGKPNYGILNSVVNNNSRFWQTDGAYIGWGGKAGFNISGKNAITVLKLDNNGDKNPTNDPDCLTDELAWAWFYGYLGSNLNADNPGDFGVSQAQLVENGPVFSEIALGTARLRYYKDQKWIMANGAVDSMFCFNKNYQFMKNGLGDEVFISNLGAGDIGHWLTGYDSGSVNPKYLAFRNPNNGVVFGAIAKDVARWYMTARCSGAWDRIISFDDSSGRANAKIYWYSDTTNSYAGIENLSKSLLSPLQVELITDSEAPSTSASVTPPAPDGKNGWYVTRPNIALESNEAGKTHYRFAVGPYNLYDVTLTVPDGVHEFSYYSEDAVGNREPVRGLSLKVDCAKPEVTAGLRPLRANNHYLVNEPITFTFDVTDTVSGVCSFAGSVDDKPVLSGRSLVFSMLGEQTLDVCATDTAGNSTLKSVPFTVGYDFGWLRPVRRPGDPADKTYATSGLSLIPLRFAARDGMGSFVADKSVRVFVSNGESSATFVYSSKWANNVVRINSCDEKYLLDIDPKSYPWLVPGGRYDVRVYFGGSYQHLGILHGQTRLELQ